MCECYWCSFLTGEICQAVWLWDPWENILGRFTVHFVYFVHGFVGLEQFLALILTAFSCFPKIVFSPSPWLHKHFPLVLFSSFHGFVEVQKVEPLWCWKDKTTFWIMLTGNPLDHSSLLDQKPWVEPMNSKCTSFYLSTTIVNVYVCAVLGSS